MTKSKTQAAFEASYDGPTTRPLKQGQPASDMIVGESYGIIKLPTVLGSALESYVIGFSEWQPAAARHRQTTEDALKAAKGDQKSGDARIVSDLLAKGPDGFGDLAGILEGTDKVAEAEAAHELATRTATAITNAVKGQMPYMNSLVGKDQREPMLDALDKAWRKFVIVSTSDSTTLGELARLESVSTEARALIGRLLTWTEGQHAGRGFDRVELERIRAAINSEEWDTLPTLERIEARNAAEAANSPEADALAAQETAKAVKREQDQRYAAEAAKARQGRRKDVTANAEEAVLLGIDTKNSGEASEADQG